MGPLNKNVRYLMNAKTISSFRILILSTIVFLCTGCGYSEGRILVGVDASAPYDFSFVGEKSPCHLELQRGDDALRVNCFHIDGTLHIHSSRWAKLPRIDGESWTVTIRRTPNVRVEIDGKIYTLYASAIDDEDQRKGILIDRGYMHAWDGITIFRFSPRPQENNAKFTGAA